jgi:hypothetical protein
MRGAREVTRASLLVGLLVPVLSGAQRGQPAAQVPSPTGSISPKTASSGTLTSGTNLTLPAGSLLHVRLTTTLTSKTNKTGDKFTGVVDQPLVANGKTIIPEGSLVDGHVAFIKPSKRIKGRAEMRIVLDSVTTPDNLRYNLAASLEDAQGSPCGKTGKDDEGTIEGCGKSKKDAAKATGIAAAAGAGIGATIGMGQEIDCEYYGNCGGAGMGTDIMYGAGIGAGTALIYSLFKHEKDVILVEGSDLTFIVNRSVQASEVPAASGSTSQ